MYGFLGVLGLFKEVLSVSLGQTAAKLQAVKVGDLKKKNSAAQATIHHGNAAWVRVPDDGMILKVLQTTTLQPFDLQRLTVPLLKDLNLFC